MIHRISVRQAFERRLEHYRNRVADSGIEAVALQLRKQGYSVEQAAAIIASVPAPVEFKVPLRDVVRSLLTDADQLRVLDEARKAGDPWCAWHVFAKAGCLPPYTSAPLAYSTVREVDERGFVKITQLDEHGRPVNYKEAP